METRKKRIAFLLKGAVSITGGVIRGFVKDKNTYVNFPIIKNSIDEHIIKPNSNEYEFDFFDTLLEYRNAKRFV